MSDSKSSWLDSGVAKAALGLLSGVAIGFAAFYPLSTPTPFSESAKDNRYERAKRNTVLIVAPDGQGSGVVVRKQNRLFVWTAAHVVEGYSEVEVKRLLHWDGRKAGEISFKARVLHSSKSQDWALLWLDAPANAFPGANFAGKDPLSPGDRVYHVGNWLGDAFDGSVSEGIVSQIGVNPGESRTGWPWSEIYLDQVNLVAMPGSSGGPIFNSAGEVVGIVVGAPGRGSLGFVCYVPVRVLCENFELCWALWGDSCPSDKTLIFAAQLYARTLHTPIITIPILIPTPTPTPTNNIPPGIPVPPEPQPEGRDIH